MKKIVSLFQRNYDGDRLVRDQLVEGAEWVAQGLGTPTKKHDGTCVLVRDGRMYKRYEVKQGGKAPHGFEPANEVDEKTGKQQGWLPVGEGPEDQWHREAVSVFGTYFTAHPDGTYELCGPKIQGNPEKLEFHTLIPHGSEVLNDVPTDFEGLKAYLSTHDIEGIVWWKDVLDPNCDKVKLKGRDYGIKRGAVLV